MLNIGNDCFVQDNDYIDFHEHGWIADDYAVRGIRDFHITQIYSAEDCQLQCQQDADCQFWVWNSPSYSHGNINTCWLKASNTKSRARTGKISGPKDCSYWDSTTTPAPTTTTPVPDGNDGRDINDDCSHLYRQNTAVGRGRNNGLFRVNNIQTIEDCRAECIKVPACKWWIWNSPETSRQRLTCWLKRNDANPRSSARDVGRISGPVTCAVDEDDDTVDEDGTVNE